MVTERVPVPDRGDDVEGSVGSDIYRLVPPWVEIGIDDARLCKPFLIFIAEYDIWITETVDVAGLQIFRFDDLDGKDIVVVTEALLWRWCMLADDFGTCIDIDFLFELVQLQHCVFNVIQLDQRLGEISVE